MSNFISNWRTKYEKRLNDKRVIKRQQEEKAAQARKEQNDHCIEIYQKIKDSFDWHKLSKKEDGYVYNDAIKVNRYVMGGNNNSRVWFIYQLVVEQDEIYADSGHTGKLYDYLRTLYEKHESDRIAEGIAKL